jgi:lysophospholipase
MTDLFCEIPGNPLPDGATGGFFTTRDRKRIRYALFPATARPLKGTVVMLTGRNECIEKYFETARDLAAQGLASASLDWRGQGGSDRLIRDRQRGHVRNFAGYVSDLDQFFREIVLPDCRGPYYILAHSTGALIALLASPLMANRVRRMVLIAPFLEAPIMPLSVGAVRRLTSVLCWLGLGRLYFAGGPRPKESAPFLDNRLTSDPARYRRNMLLYETFPRLALGGPTIRWVKAAAQASQIVRDPTFIQGIQMPILIVAAGDDRVVSNKAIEDYASRLRLGSMLTIDGAQHEILQEADLYREQFLAAFNAFVPGTEDSGG